MMASSASLKCSSCGRDDFKYKRSLVKHERFNCHAKRKTMGDIENKSELKVMKLSKEETKIVISDAAVRKLSGLCQYCLQCISRYLSHVTCFRLSHWNCKNTKFQPLPKQKQTIALRPLLYRNQGWP